MESTQTPPPDAEAEAVAVEEEGGLTPAPLSTEDAVAKLSSSSQKTRIELLKRLGEADIHGNDQPELIIDGIFSTLFVYSASKSIAAVEQLLKKILITNSANNQVIKHFVTSLRSATSASLKAIASSSYQSRLALLRWYCIFLENYTKRDLPVFPILLSELSSLLASFVDLPEGARDNAFHRFTATIKNPDLFQLYIKRVTEEEPSLTHIIFAGLLLTHIKRNPAKLPEYKAKFLDWYTKAVIASTTLPHRLAHELFTPLITSLDANEYANSVVPALVRVLKRSPEVAAWNATVLLELSTQKSFDSAQYKDLLAAVFPLIMGNSDKLRADGIAILRQILLRAKTGAGFAAIVTEITKQTPLQYPYQRIAIFQSLINAAERLGPSAEPIDVDVNAVVPAILTLIPVIDKEASEEARCLGLRALGTWIRFTTALPEPAVKLFGTQLKSDKEPIKVAAIEALEASVDDAKPGDKDRKDSEVRKPDPAKAQQAAQFVEALYATIKSAKGPKVAEIGSPVSAARLLLKLASALPTIEEKLDKAFWQAVLGGGPLLYNPIYITRMTNEKEATSFSRLFETVLTLYSPRFNKSSNDAEAKAALCISVMTTLAHPVWQVRREAVGALARMHERLPKLADLMVPVAVKFLRDLSANSATLTQTPQTLAAALNAVTAKSLSDSSIPALFVAAHLPYVDSHAWTQISKSLGKNSTSILENEAIAKEVVAYAVSSEALISKDANFQIAGQRALATATRDANETILPNVVPAFQELLSAEVLAPISATDIAVFKTPEGELYAKVDTGEYVPQVRQDKRPVVEKERRKRGERGMYSKAELEFEEKLRREQEEKKKKEEEAKNAEANVKKYSDLELKVLAKESETRANLTRIKANFEAALKGVQSVATAHRDAVHAYLRTLIDILLPVVSHSLTSELTPPSLEALARCVQPPAAAALASPISHLIHTIYAPKEIAKLVPDNYVVLAMTKVLTALHAMTAAVKRTLGAASFSYVFPVLRAALEKSYSFTIQDTALDVVEIHLTHGGNYPRGAMIASLTTLVASSPRLEPRAKAAIITLGAGLRTTDMTATCAAFIHQDPNVRNAVLGALDRMPLLTSLPEMESVNMAVWAGKHDTDATNVALADTIWTRYSHPLTDQPERYLSLFIPHLGHAEGEVRRVFAGAIAGAFRVHVASIPAALDQVFALHASLLPADGDPNADTPANIRLRHGIATVFFRAADVFKGENLVTVFDWFIDGSLGDSDETVNQELVNAGMEIVNQQGAEFQSILFPIFEKFLARPDSGTRLQDRVRESVIIFMGVLAKHVVGDEARVSIILARLVDALKTPSELVQQAVSKCLAQLIPAVKSSAPALVAKLLKTLREARQYPALRGAAYGLAGAVKGCGIIALKQYEILQALGTQVEDKKSQSSRQGALLAFECLSNTLGRGFEPYVIQILPKLLVCLGDSQIDVRAAAGAAAKAIMGQLSGHGVKLVLPALLKALEDRSWRTKEGSIELLGAMAFCAPKQLSSCLPTIVPRLVEVLTDTHEAVQKATKEALAHVGSVIRNPEIQIHVPKILRALVDPENTKDALDALLTTNYVHSIDAPSLSLIMPLLDRGLRDRATDTKKKGAQIVGNMCSLTDPKELIPYLPLLIPDLKKVVIDPIPEVRTMAAVAMGSLVSGMGEEQFGSLIQWMLDTIKSDNGSVERGGAAQGLANVLGALGPDRLQTLFPDLVAATHNKNFYVREGSMYMFCFLPLGMSKGFQTFLPRVMPCVLGGLADDSEVVREVAMRAGLNIVNEYYISAVDVLVPCLEEGLFSDNWRIRQSSVSLLGDFMAKLTGADTPEADLEDDNDRTARAKTDITKVMGEGRVHSILAALYMIRFDVNTAVRQKSMLVWKSLVNNTPKTLREILPTLMTTLISCMGSNNTDKRQVAARTLGDLVSKLGERVMPEIIPMLDRGLDARESDKRLGVCVGLTEVIAAAGRQQLGNYIADVIPTVRRALQDRLADVREAAAQAFDMLYTSIGPKVLDDVLPPLLASLSKEREAAQARPEGTEASSPAADALRQILLVRSQAVLPFLVPKLIAKPLTAPNATALSSIASVAGPALNEHLSEILPVLLEASTNPSRPEAETKEIKTATETIILAVQDEGLEILIPELLQQLEDEEATTRAGAAELLAAFCNATKADIEDFTQDLIVSLLGLFNDSEQSVLVAAWNALGAVTKTIKKENLSFLEAVDEGMETVSDELPDEGERILPGFCIPKGIQPILPLLLNGLMLGSPEQRELSAVLIGQAIKLTSTDALKPFVVQITGPLIRVIADRFPWQVKSAILATLSLLITKGAASMKPFLPQLQTTFIKALHDPTAVVRTNAADALGKLMGLGPRVDPLLNELLGGVSSTEGGVQEGMVGALRRVLEKAPATVDQAALLKVANALTDLLEHNEEKMRKVVAKTLAAYAKIASAEQLDTYFTNNLLQGEASTWQGRQGRAIAIYQLLKQKPDLATKHYKPLLTKLPQLIKDDRPGVRQAAAEIIGLLLVSTPAKSGELIPLLTQLLNDTSSEVPLAALSATKQFAKAHPKEITNHLVALIPLVVARLKDKLVAVKLEAERVLLHALQIHSNPNVFKDYVATTDAVFNKYITDYVTKVIKKMSPESEEEEEDEDEA